jgi:hypothetical protein
MRSCPYAHCSRRRSGREVAAAPFRVGFRSGLRLYLPSRLANASGRIEFIIFLIMDWSFASGCSPPRLSATQFPSATDSQCSVRWGLPPHCWCALSGALSKASRFTRAKPSVPHCVYTGRAKSRTVRSPRRQSETLCLRTGKAGRFTYHTGWKPMLCFASGRPESIRG